MNQITRFLPTALSCLTSVLFSVSTEASYANSVYASSVVQSSPLANGSADGLLGAPDRIDSAYDQADSTTPGFVIVSFDHSFIDIAGSDLTVYVVEWPLSENEAFEVFASVDGSPGTFLRIGESGPPTGVSSETVAVSFDLASAGLASARFVRIQNARIDLGAQWEGPEIDAIEGIQAVPEPPNAMMLGIGLLLVTEHTRRRLRPKKFTDWTLRSK